MMPHPCGCGGFVPNIRVSWRLTFLLALTVSLYAATAGATTGVKLHWTAPGDDGLLGRATLYDVRYSSVAITPTNFALAKVVTGLPAPSMPGSQDSVSVLGLTAGVPYYFAIKTGDDANNWSAISNLLLKYGFVLGVDDVGGTLLLEAPWPNPAASLTHFAYSLPVESIVAADAFDITGRHVREIASGRRSAGRGEFVWNLRDDSGRAVRPGVYLVRTRIAGRSWTHHVAVAA
jgi:hypothetical protein